MKSNRFKTTACFTALFALTLVAFGRISEGALNELAEKKKAAKQAPQAQPQPQPQRQIEQPRQQPQRQIEQPRQRTQIEQPQRQIEQPRQRTKIEQPRQRTQLEQPQIQKRQTQIETPQPERLATPSSKPKVKLGDRSPFAGTGRRNPEGTNEADHGSRTLSSDAVRKGLKDPVLNDPPITDTSKKVIREPRETSGLKITPDLSGVPSKKSLQDSPAGTHRPDGILRDQGAGKTRRALGAVDTGDEVRRPSTDADPAARLPHPTIDRNKLGVGTLSEPKIQKHSNGSITTSRFSEKGKLAEKTLEQKNGSRQISRFNNHGNLSEQIDANKDGTQHKTRFNDLGKKTREEVSHNDGSREVTTHQFARSGQTRSSQIIKHNTKGLAISKTVTLKRPVILSNRTAFEGKPIVKSYDRGRFGFVYHHGHSEHVPLMAFRHDSYWHHNDGSMYRHPFRYDWGWDRHDWYRHRSYYFPIYTVYPTPIYWITDWMVGSYIADGYDSDAYISDAPDREIVIVREHATPISNELKEDLRAQIENTIAEEQAQTENVSESESTGEDDKPVSSDLAKSLADLKHIYPVSGTLSVTLASDENQSVMVSDGDLLKLEPGQNDILAEATENTFVTMRVMTSKGEEGEARAGMLISISLKSLQDFDSEFRARIDQGVAEAVENKELFKKGAEGAE